jgi:hypothetical protein
MMHRNSVPEWPYHGVILFVFVAFTKLKGANSASVEVTAELSSRAPATRAKYRRQPKWGQSSARLGNIKPTDCIVTIDNGRPMGFSANVLRLRRLVAAG